MIASASHSATVVDRAAAARDALRAEARRWIADQTRSSLDMIEVGALDSRVDPSSCESGYDFDFPFQSRTTVRARCMQPARQLYLRVSVTALESRITVNRDLAAGHVLQPSDLSSRMIRQSGTGIADASAAVGRALSRPLNAGEMITPRDLDEVITVVRTLVPLSAGERIGSAVLRRETIPKREAPIGAIPADEAIQLSLHRAVPAGHVIQQDDLIDRRPVVVAKRPLLRGEKLSEAAFEVVERDRRQIPPDYLASPEGLDHSELITTVRAGEILRTSQIRRSAVIKKGQLVLLTVNRSGIEISVRVEALEDARVGEQVKLRNPDSGKALAGVATGQGSARAL